MSDDTTHLEVLTGGGSVIRLKERSRVSRTCPHTNIIVDEKLSEVLCSACGEKLNPIYVLVRMTREESLWKQTLERFKESSARLDARSRTKCEHCGAMTRISDR